MPKLQLENILEGFGFIDKGTIGLWALVEIR